jgi:hypothetical protein
MYTFGKAIQEIGDEEGLPYLELDKNLVEKLAIRLFSNTNLAGCKSDQDEILTKILDGEILSISQQYQLGLITDQDVIYECKNRNDIADSDAFDNLSR